VIDRIRQEIQDRLEQLLAEAEKLRAALVALDPRSGPKPQRSPARSNSSRRPARSTAPAPASPPPAASRRASAPRAAAKTATSRTAPGATKNSVLDALKKGGALTAGEVATATGLGRGTVSTTLSKLAKSGVVVKADRGYKLPDGSDGASGAKTTSTSASSSKS
jgi:DNA-binding transcriptional ArsR family regulator